MTTINLLFAIEIDGHVTNWFEFAGEFSVYRNGGWLLKTASCSYIQILAGAETEIEATPEPGVNWVRFLCEQWHGDNDPHVYTFDADMNRRLVSESLTDLLAKLRAEGIEHDPEQAEIDRLNRMTV